MRADALSTSWPAVGIRPSDGGAIAERCPSHRPHDRAGQGVPAYSPKPLPPMNSRRIDVGGT